jgi:hypothetical protein
MMFILGLFVGVFLGIVIAGFACAAKAREWPPPNATADEPEDM